MPTSIRQVLRICFAACLYAVGLVLVWQGFVILVVERGDFLAAAWGIGLGLGIWQVAVWFGLSKPEPDRAIHRLESPVSMPVTAAERDPNLQMFSATEHLDSAPKLTHVPVKVTNTTRFPLSSSDEDILAAARG